MQAAAAFRGPRVGTSAPRPAAFSRHPLGRRALPPPLTALPAGELFQTAASVSTTFLEAVNGIAAACPEPLKPFISVLGGDLASVLALNPNPMALPRLGAVWYLFFSYPTPLVHIIDFYITEPLAKATSGNAFNGSVFTLRDRLGGGNFGITYEAVLDKERVENRTLTQEQKNKRVVVKKVATDGRAFIRKNILKQGTMARGAVETGVVEAYMCRKAMRFPLVRPVVAKYLGEYEAKFSDGGFTQGGEWLVWSFESDSTLGDALEGRLGSFPGSIADLFIKGVALEKLTERERDARVVKLIMKQLFQGVRRLHKIGIVHRDIKPENILVTVNGEIKVIDFGAAVDFSIGINFNPMSGMLDFRYSPPEELITPLSFPKPPLPVLAALAAPVAWQAVRPDLFDTFSCGLLLLQLSIPQMRTAMQQKNFKSELEKYDYDLYAWRESSPKAKVMDLSLLDMNNGAGFDLAAKLVCKRNKYFRGRLNATQALRHRYFLFG